MLNVQQIYAKTMAPASTPILEDSTVTVLFDTRDKDLSVKGPQEHSLVKGHSWHLRSLVGIVS